MLNCLPKHFLHQVPCLSLSKGAFPFNSFLPCQHPDRPRPRLGNGPWISVPPFASCRVHSSSSQCAWGNSGQGACPGADRKPACHLWLSLGTARSRPWDWETCLACLSLLCPLTSLGLPSMHSLSTHAACLPLLNAELPILSCPPFHPQRASSGQPFLSALFWEWWEVKCFLYFEASWRYLCLKVLKEYNVLTKELIPNDRISGCIARTL